MNPLMRIQSYIQPWRLENSFTGNNQLNLMLGHLRVNRPYIGKSIFTNKIGRSLKAKKDDYFISFIIRKEENLL